MQKTLIEMHKRSGRVANRRGRLNVCGVATAHGHVPLFLLEKEILSHA